MLASLSPLYVWGHPIQDDSLFGPGRGYQDGCVSISDAKLVSFILPKESFSHTFRARSDLCGRHVSKRPYGELGSVDRGTCLCCVNADSAFGPISPGCGCETEKVDDIVSELKARMRQRGDTAQINRAEETLKRLDEVDAKLVSSMSM